MGIAWVWVRYPHTQILPKNIITQSVTLAIYMGTADMGNSHMGTIHMGYCPQVSMNLFIYNPIS